jgi:FkbM family methyltransferase
MLQIDKKNLFHILKELLPHNPTIIEGGAFIGNDTLRMARNWPDGTIYAFEPIPEIFRHLYHNTKGYHNIYPIQLALGNHDGPSLFWPAQNPKKNESPSQAGSLLPPKERLTWSETTFHEPIEIPTVTLASWVTEQEIDEIDFLWLDLQGYELPVMQASEEIIRQIPLIYTEVHFVEAYQGQAQYLELKKWLESIGFTMIAKDFGQEPTWFFGNALFKNNHSQSL